MKYGRSKAILFGLLLLVNVVSFMAPHVSATGEDWLTGWDERQGITITGTVGASTDYQVFLNVTYDSNMQTDFDDLRCTDDNGITLLDYWLEDYTASTFANVWVEVRDNLNETQIIYLYWGNDAVSTTSNGTDTFLFFDDFEYSGTPDPAIWVQVGSSGDITCNGQDLVLTGTGGTQEGYGGLWGSDTVNTTLHYRGNSTSTNTLGHEYGLWDVDNLGDIGQDCAYIYGNINPLYGTLFTRNGSSTGSTAGDAPYAKTSDRVWSFNWFENSTARYVEVYQGNNLSYSQSGASISDGNSNLTAYFGNGINTYYVHYVFLAKYVGSEPTVTFAIWEVEYEFDFVLPVSWNPAFQFGYDSFFIFLGLIMIPLSTMYLVRGGRKEMSTDKFFYGIVIFAVGVGLLIGGILP